MTKISDERLDDLIANAAGAAEEAWWLDDVADALTELKQLRAHNSDSAEPMAWRCEDLILSNISIIDDWEHAQARILQPKAWRVKPLYLVSPPAKEVESWIKALEEALSPFADQAGTFDSLGGVEFVPDEFEPAIVTHTIGDLRRARAALTNRTPDDEVGNE